MQETYICSDEYFVSGHHALFQYNIAREKIIHHVKKMREALDPDKEI